MSSYVRTFLQDRKNKAMSNRQFCPLSEPEKRADGLTHGVSSEFGAAWESKTDDGVRSAIFY